MVRSCRERGCNFKIQKSSNKLQICDFDNDLLSTSSMTVILAWALKLWTISKRHFYVLLFIIKLYSDFLTHCDFLQRQHSIRDITQLFLQVSYFLLTKVFFINARWKAEQVLSWVVYNCMFIYVYKFLNEYINIYIDTYMHT